MEYISEEIKLVIKKIATDYPDVVFCGSLGLVLNDKLHREVKDIDVLVTVNYHLEGGFYNSFRIGNSTSHKFMVGKDEVLCFKLEFPILDKKIGIDVLYNKNVKPEFKIFDFFETKINVETPESAIKAKLLYIQNDNSIISVGKHLKDLIYLEVDKHKIIEAINNSNVFNEIDLQLNLDF